MATNPFMSTLPRPNSLPSRRVPRLIDAIRWRGIVPCACIVGETSMMDVVRSHKGEIGSAAM